MTTTNTFNKKEIMIEAWVIYKNHEGLLPFSNCLKAAWHYAKSLVKALQPKRRPVVDATSPISMTVGQTRYYCGNENSGMRTVTV